MNEKNLKEQLNWLKGNFITEVSNAKAAGFIVIRDDGTVGHAFVTGSETFPMIGVLESMKKTMLDGLLIDTKTIK